MFSVESISANPGGMLLYSTLAVVGTGLLGGAVTKSAGFALFVAFATCWGLTLAGLTPIWASLLCSGAVLGGVFVWGLWFRE